MPVLELKIKIAENQLSFKQVSMKYICIVYPDKYWEQRENPKGEKRARPPAQSLEILD